MPVRHELAATALTDLLFEEPGVGRCLVAPDGSVLRANAEWLRSTGFGLDDVLGSDIIDLFPEARDAALAMHARVRAGHRVVVPRHARTVNGRETWWEGSVAPVPMENGAGLLITTREVTDHVPRASFEAERRSSALLRAIADTIPDPVFVKDTESRLVFANPATLTVIGKPAEDVIGRTDLEIYDDPGVGAAIVETDRRIMDSGQAVAVEERIQTPTGYQFFLSTKAPFRDEAGKVAGLVGVARDITERKRADDALRESETRYRLLFQNMLDGFAYCRMIFDERGRPEDFVYLEVNGAFGVLTGLGDVVGKKASEVFPGIRDSHPELLEIYGRVARTGRPERVEIPFRPLALWLTISVHRPHPDHFVAVFDDITDRKRAEESLAVVTRLYAVLSHVNEAIVRTTDERSLYGEVCRIVAEDGGFPLVWVGLLKQREVAPAASSGRATDYLREIKVEVEGELGQGPTGTCVREDRPVINYDFGTNPSARPWRQSTEKHGLRASAAFPLHRGGKVIGALTFYAERPGAFAPEIVRLLEALCADISYALDAMQQEHLRAEAETALRASEQSLREADRRKDEFLGMLSHELRNPLAPIRNSVYLLKLADPAGEQAARARAVIERQSEHLTRLVDDLLDVTRIARGKIELRPSRLDLRELVLRAADDFRVMMDERGLSFHTVLPPTRMLAEGDATRLTQVIGNLLHNAAKFTQRGDAVTLSLEPVDGEAEIRVRDTGAGIDAAVLPHVFDPFYQGHHTLERSEGGLGLGLALVRGIVDLHGGTVRAESGGRGRGTEFVIRLPLGRATSRDRLRPTVKPADAVHRVLIVDDNRDAADSLAEIVEMLGHRAQVVYDGPSAIERARSTAPDIVLCDIGLPGMSGYEVARALRAVARNAMLLVALTGYTQPEDMKKAVESGFDRHLAKPASAEDIERLLG
jgi:PAS domain S-box-containing protein